MNRALADKVARAVLYEGYMLYPYRPALKNQQRWTFGGVYPPAYSEQGNGTASMMQTQCLLAANRETSLEVQVRFLHITPRTVGEFSQPVNELPAGARPAFRPVEMLEVGGQRFHTWQDAEEREIRLAPTPLEALRREPRHLEFAFPQHREVTPLRQPSGRIVGVLLREQQALSGAVELAVEKAAADVFMATVKILNRTSMADADRESRDDAVFRSFASTHTVLGVRAGEFISLIDPPEHLHRLAEGCRNIGTWPVLVGEGGAKDTMLSAPIILYDYPEIAPESPGDLFDATEIDEMLTFRILTLTDSEKREMAAVDARARELLDRTQALTREQLMRLHGVVRNLRPLTPEQAPSATIEQVASGPSTRGLRPGAHVRLRPRRRADIMDLALTGKTAVIVAVERDYDNRIHLAVTIDDDPGRDLGMAWQPAHRFFFSPEEVELLEDGQ